MAKVAGPTLSGKSAALSVDSQDVEFGKWSANEEWDEESYATSHTNGKKKAEAGNGQLKGQVEGKRRTDGGKIEAIAQGGEKYPLILYFQDAGAGISVPSALISNLGFEADPSTGAVQSYSFSFVSDGDWTYI